MARMQYEQARGAVEQAEGAVAAASSVAADSRVVAPFAGRVYRRIGRGRRPGGARPAAADARVRRAAPDAACRCPRAWWSRAASGEGDELPVAIDTRPDLGRMIGRIVERSPGADPASHSFEFLVALPVEDLPTGAVGRAWIEGGRQARVVVPADALLRRGGGLTLVVLRDAEGTAATRVVTVGGAGADGRVEILSGLAGGESVLVGLDGPPPAGARVEELAAAPVERGRDERRPRTAGDERGAPRGAAPQADPPAAGRLGADRQGVSRVQADAAAGGRVAAGRRLRGPGDAARGGAADQGADDRRLRRLAGGHRAGGRAAAGRAAREGDLRDRQRRVRLLDLAAVGRHDRRPLPGRQRPGRGGGPGARQGRARLRRRCRPAPCRRSSRRAPSTTCRWWPTPCGRKQAERPRAAAGGARARDRVRAVTRGWPRPG